MINCFDGRVVSWTIGTRTDSDLVNTMLDAAIETVATSVQCNPSFIQIVNSCIRWYNEKRIKISLGSLSPIGYRASLGISV